MTLSGHFDENVAEAIKAAAGSDPKQHGAVSRWIVESCKQRLEREGLLPGDPRAAIWAAVEELGVNKALRLLTNRSR
jgi:hypothetical protein